MFVQQSAYPQATSAAYCFFPDPVQQQWQFAPGNQNSYDRVCHQGWNYHQKPQDLYQEPPSSIGAVVFVNHSTQTANQVDCGFHSPMHCPLESTLHQLPYQSGNHASVYQHPQTFPCVSFHTYQDHMPTSDQNGTHASLPGNGFHSTPQPTWCRNKERQLNQPYTQHYVCNSHGQYEGVFQTYHQQQFNQPNVNVQLASTSESFVETHQNQDTFNQHRTTLIAKPVASPNEGDTSNQQASNWKSMSSPSGYFPPEAPRALKNLHNSSCLSASKEIVEKPFACSECPFRTKWYENLSKHIKTHTHKISFNTNVNANSTPKTLSIKPCKLASSKKLNDSNLSSTEKEHVEKPFACPKCQFRTKWFENLNKHILTHTKRFVCTKCPFSTNYKIRFNAHINTHKASKILSLRPRALAQLKKIHDSKLTRTNKDHRGKRFACPKCQFRTNGHKRLVRHMKSHIKRFVCTKCPFSTNHKIRFNAHVNVHSASTILSCKHCPYKTKVKKCMLDHILKTHPAVPLASSYTKIQNKNIVLQSIETILQQRTSENDSGFAQCGVCKRVFDSRDRLRSHMVTSHLEGYTFQCDYCEIRFKDRIKLNSHIRVAHNDTRNFKCQFCKKCYKTKFYCKMHERLHCTVARTRRGTCEIVKEAMHHCTVCPKVFKQRCTLLWHLRKIHNVTQFSDPRSSHFRTCSLCTTTHYIPNSATRFFHRNVYHPLRCAPQERMPLSCIHTTKKKLIYFRDAAEINIFMAKTKEEPRKCKACEITYYNDSGLSVHFDKCHNILNARALRDDMTSVLARIQTMNQDEHLRLFKEMRINSAELIDFYDNRHKIYKLLFVSKKVLDSKLQDFIQLPGNPFFMYIGGLSYKNGYFVSAHHIYKGRHVSTNLLMEILKDYRCVLIQETYISKEEGLSHYESQQKAEALAILTLFMFHKMWRKSKDVFFQNMEWGQLKTYLTPEIFRQIKEDVAGCGGNILNLKGFAFMCFKPISIYTEDIQKDHTSFSICKHCPEHGPFPSQYYSVKHRLEYHGGCNQSTIVRLITIPSVDNIMGIIDDLKVDKTFSSYTVAGIRKKLNCEEVMDYLKECVDTPLYQGASVNSVISMYHFDENSSSTLKKLKGKNLQLYQLCHFEFENAQDMYKFEASIIIIGILRSHMKERSRLFKLANAFVKLYDIARIFSTDEWEQLYEYAISDKCFITTRDLPQFLAGVKRIDHIINVTDKVPISHE